MFNIDELLGLPLNEAEAKAIAAGFIVRVTVEDGNAFI